MKRYLASMLLMSPAFAFAQESPAVNVNNDGASSDYYAAKGEGKTLPESVMRVRLAGRFATVEKSYDKDGKAQNMPVKASINGGALVLEYGLNDRLSLQVKTNVYFSQKTEAKSKSSLASDPTYLAAQSAVRAEKIEANLVPTQTAALDSVATKLATSAAFGCGANKALCLGALNNGTYKIPTDYTFDATAGGLAGLTIPANTPWGPYLNAAVKAKVEATVDAGLASGFYDGFKDSAEVKKTGKTGVGDTDIGALYAIVTEDESPVAVSVGGGLRIPTGKLILDPEVAELSTGRGTMDLGLRFNIDYPVVKGLYLCLQNQTEFMLVKGKVKIMDTDYDVKREGIRNIGTVRVNWGLGNMTQALAPVGLYGSYNYDYDSKLKVGDTAASDASQVASSTVGIVGDGLAYKIPAQLEVEYDMPVSGKNGARVAKTLGVTLKAFYKF